MFIIEEEQRDSAILIEAQGEAQFRTAVFAADLPYGLERYREIFEGSGEEEGFTPQNEREFQKMLLDMKRLEVAGEL